MRKHYNTKESAHKIIRSIIAKSDETERVGILLQEELARKGARFTDTALGNELKMILEADILLIQNQLLEHRNERPPESYKKSKIDLERHKWRQWEHDNSELARNLELRQIQLKRMNSFVVSRIHFLPRCHC